MIGTITPATTLAAPDAVLAPIGLIGEIAKHATDFDVDVTIDESRIPGGFGD